MSKITDAIAAKLSAEAAKEFNAAVKELGYYLLDNSKSEYVSKGKADAELTTANKSRDDLAAKLETLQAEAAKGGETTAELEKKLKEAMDAHKTEVAELKAGADRDKKSNQVKQALTQAGARDADLALTALGLDLDKLNYDDKGNILGLSDLIKAQQEAKTFLYEVKEPKNTHMQTVTTDKSVDALIDGELSKLGYKFGDK